MPTTRSESLTSPGSRGFPEPAVPAGSHAAFAWLLAVRPRTLGASVVPVCVGLAAVARSAPVDIIVAIVTLLCAALLQVTANLANDYYDFVRGVDDERRLGPTRVTQAGLLSPRAVLVAARLTLATAIACGGYLVAVGGIFILAIGLAAAAGALAYSAGPRPLSWYGLGDLMAFTFFGPIAVAGTVVAQQAAVDHVALLAGLPLGCLVTALIVVNNLRDIDCDARAGKRTLAVRIGARATRLEHAVLVAGAYLAVLPLALGAAAPWTLLALVSLPLGIHETRSLWRRADAELNLSLVGTARLHAVFGMLLVVGLLV